MADSPGLDRRLAAERADQALDPSASRPTPSSSSGRGRAARLGHVGGRRADQVADRDEVRRGPLPAGSAPSSRIPALPAATRERAGPRRRSGRRWCAPSPPWRRRRSGAEPSCPGTRGTSKASRRIGPAPRPAARRTSLPSMSSRRPSLLGSAPPPIRKWMNLRSIVNSGLVSLPLYSSAAAGSSPCRIMCVLTNPLPS